MTAHHWRISDQEPGDWDWAADKEVKKMTTPDRPTCKVCMADLANGDPHEPWCTLKDDWLTKKKESGDG